MPGTPRWNCQENRPHDTGFAPSSVNVSRHASLRRLAWANSSFAICTAYFVTVTYAQAGRSGEVTERN